MTHLLIHGSWHNGTVWQKVETLLKQQGATVYAPALAGFESIEKPAPATIGLNTHIQNVVDLIQQENLHG